MKKIRNNLKQNKLIKILIAILPVFIVAGFILSANTYYDLDLEKIIIGHDQRISGHVLPSSTDSYDLGSVDYKWANIYAATGTFTALTVTQGSTGNIAEFKKELFKCGDNVTFTYKGETVTYDTVNSTNTTCWLDRNLGASQVAASSTDSDAYGDIFQWGRLNDGHQIRTSVTTTTLSTTVYPGHSDFIINPSVNYDWLHNDNKNDLLWQGVSGINNPCPSGWRLPTETEWETERLSWSSNNTAGAFGSPLKLTVAGLRNYSAGSLLSVDTGGYYWSSSVLDINARFLDFYSAGAHIGSGYRADGFTVRCLKGEKTEVKLVITNSGNVGIGTDDPQYTLDIDGTLGVTGISTFALIDAGTWQADQIATQYGGTGQNFSSVSAGNIVFFSDTGEMSATTTLPSDVQDNITRLGTVSSGIWQGTEIGAQYGGTGLTTYSEGDIVYASATSTLAKLTIGVANTVLTSSGSAPQWSTSLNLAGTLNVTGTTTLGSATSTPTIFTGYVQSDIIPYMDNTYTLGTSDYRWANIYAATGTFGGGTITIGTDAITGSATTTLSAGSANQLVLTSDGKVGINTATPQYTLDVNGTLGVTGTSTFSGHILPAADRTYNLGSADLYWENIYAKNVSGHGFEVVGNKKVVTDEFYDDSKISTTTDLYHDTVAGEIELAKKIFECGNNVTFTYKGETVTYGTVNSTNTTCWLDRNLGASQVAASSTDSDAYGDIFQWGRLDDGHQIRTSATTTTLSTTDDPGHSDFIINPSVNYDWLHNDNKNDLLWQGVSGINNPCPSGWRLPTETEWETERLSWSSNNTAGAFGSPLKLTVAGFRNYSAGSLGSSGSYWSSTVSGTNNAYGLDFYSTGAYMFGGYRAYGFSVRCIQD